MTTRRMFVLFNHTLSDAQRADARASLGVTDFVVAPDALRKRWGSIDPHEDVRADLAESVVSWLRDEGAGEDDLLFVQGDAGATFVTVQAVERAIPGLRCWYATTERRTVEKVDGDTVTKQSVFEHVAFRTYGLG